MISIKQFAKITALGIALVLAVAISTWLRMDDATLITVLERRIETLSDIRISHASGGRITRTLTPALELKKLVIEDRAARYRVEVSSLQIQLSLVKLLLGELDIPLLQLGDVRIIVIKTDADKTAVPQIRALPLQPVLHHVQMGKISLLREGKELHLPEVAVDEITVRQDIDSNTLAFAAQIQWAREKFAVVLALPDLHNALVKRLVAFSVSAQSAAIHFGADGTIKVDQAVPFVEAAIRATVSDLSKVPVGNAALVVPGTLTANAQLAGSVDQPMLSKLVAQWKEPGQSDLKLTGEIDNLANLEGLHLDLIGKLDNPRWLLPMLPDNLGNVQGAELSAKISGAYKQLSVQAFNLHVASADALDLSLQGQFDVVPAARGLHPENIDLHLKFSAPTTHAARVLLFEKIPELGAISGTADIRAAAGTPMLENILIKTKDLAVGINVDLSGRIANVPIDSGQSISGYALDVLMKAGNTSVLAKRLGVNLPVSGPTTLAYRIEGDTQALAVKQIHLSAGEKKTVQIGAQGQLLFGNWALVSPLQMVDLKFQVNSKDTKSLNSLIGGRLPELGSLSASARLHTVSGKHQFDDLIIQNNRAAPVQISFVGSVADVLVLPQPALKNIQLKADMQSKNSAQLNALFGLKEKIPAIGPFKANAKISGSDRGLQVADVLVTAGQNDIVLVTADGRLGLNAKNNWQLQNVDLRVNATSVGSSALAKSLGYPLPELGPIQVHAKIIDQGKTLGIEAAVAQIGNAAIPVVKATGFVDDLFGTGKTRWDVNLNMDGHTLAAFADKQKLPDLGSLVGSMVIANTDGSLGIDALDLKSTETALLSLTVKGRFDDFKKPETLQLESKATARDLQLVGALFDQDWPPIGPVEVNSKISRVDGATQFDSLLSAGDSKANAAIKGRFDVTPPLFSGNITVQHYMLPDIVQDVVEHSKEKGEKKKKQTKPKIFSTAPIDLSWLKKADLDLSVDIASFNRGKSNIQSAQFVIAVQSGHLSIKPATLNYTRGKLDLDLQINAQTPPQVSFKAYGENINPWQTLDIQQDTKTYDADLDIDMALTTSGVSLHEMAANANGDLYATMKNGKINRALLDMVMVDLIGWTAGKTTREKFYDVDCGVADYSIKQGVITTKAFLLDSKNIAIGGEGSIDLGLERIDYVLLPKKKSRISFNADPVKISGALSDPSVRVIPWKSAVTAYGELLFAPYIFVGITAADYAAKAIGIGPKSSPCEEYEKRTKSNRGTAKK